MKRLVSFYMIVVAALLFFPPWERTYQKPGVRELRDASLGHYAIVSPPPPGGGRGIFDDVLKDALAGYSVTIDWSLLLLEIGFVSLLFGIVVLWLRQRQENRHQEPSAHLATSKS